MTAPCRNCHRPPSAPNPKEETYLWDGATQTIRPAPPEKDPYQAGGHCHAQEQWPKDLRENQASLQKFPWWVRHNFETTRIALAEAQGRPYLPFRISIAKADVDVNLRLNPGEFSLKSIGPYDAFDLILNPGAELSIQVHVKDNQIPLALQSLVRFYNIEVDGPLPVNIWPETISVGDFGGIHLVGKTTPTVHSVINQPMALRPDLGHDMPTGDQFQNIADPSEVPELVYPNYPEGPMVDLDPLEVFRTITKNPNLGAEFLEPNGRLPETYNLETFLVRLLDFLSKPKSPKDPKAPNPDLEKLLSLDTLKSGETRTFNILLNDFYKLGTIDLGPSKLEIKATLTSDKKIQIQIPGVNLKLDAFDYPGILSHLETGSIQAGNTMQVIDGKLTPPGIDLLYDPKEKTLLVKTNLDLNAEITPPLVGTLRISGKILSRMKFSPGKDGFRLEPKGSFVHLKDLVVAKKGSDLPWLSNLNIVLTDDPYQFKVGSLKYGLAKAGAPLAHVAIRGVINEGSGSGKNTKVHEHPLDLNGVILLPLTENGDYDFPKVPFQLALELQAKLGISEGGQYRGTFGLNPVAVPSSADPERQSMGYVAQFQLDYSPKDQKEFRAMLESGQLEFKWLRHDSDSEQFIAELGVKSIQVETPVGEVSLKDLSSKVLVTMTQPTEDALQFSVAEAFIGVNPKGNPRGLLQGPIRIEQAGDKNKGLVVTWNGAQRQVDVQNLNLLLKAKGIQFRSLVPPEKLKFIEPSIASLGLDGSFGGNYTMFFAENPKDWEAKGLLVLKGDRQSDIQLYDKRGQSYGPSLFRDTYWTWRNIDWVNLNRGRAMGNFVVYTNANPRGLFSGANEAYLFREDEVEAYGAKGERLRPYEISGEMSYDNQPWTPTGFANVVVDYLFKLCLQNDSCREQMKETVARTKRPPTSKKSKPEGASP